jgi:hypothetical protein
MEIVVARIWVEDRDVGAQRGDPGQRADGLPAQPQRDRMHRGKRPAPLDGGHEPWPALRPAGPGEVDASPNKTASR